MLLSLQMAILSWRLRASIEDARSQIVAGGAKEDTAVGLIKVGFVAKTGPWS
jgi:hypothetical protein